MARKYYRRRFYRKRGRWSSRIYNLQDQQTVGALGTLLVKRDLATNPQQNNGTVSQKYTVKNVYLQFTVSVPDEISYISNCQMYVMFIPQGISEDSNTPFNHLEWIMAYRYIGLPVSPNNPGYAPIVIRSRLSRNLDTGDRIIFMLYGNNNSSTSNQTVNLRGIVRFNTKAN